MAAHSAQSGPSSLFPTPVLQLVTPTPKTTMSDKTKRRCLILCFDGTANQYDDDNTNVVKLYSLLKKDDTEEQICYYQPGVGTYFQPGVVSPFFQWAAKIMDEAFAWYLDAHVRGGYTFLMQNYRAGDKLCIFGFSRGAYTARALAGLIHKIGLLPKDNPEQVPFAYKLFKQTDAESLKLAVGYKRTFCRDVEIEFVGVWDTVASVGVLMARNLPFTTANTTIKTFRHALSLDEHRVKFRPNLYHRPAPDAEGAKRDPNQATPVMNKAKESVLEKMAHAVKGEVGRIVRRVSGKSNKNRRKQTTGKRVTRRVKTVGTGLSSVIVQETTEAPPDPLEGDGSAEGGDGDGKEGVGSGKDEVKSTDVLEVWFSGCHSDVGGGSVPDSTLHSLSDITLRWMVRQVVLSQCGISFDSDALARAKIPNSVFTGVGFPVTPPVPGMGAGSGSGMAGTQTTLKLKPVDDNESEKEKEKEKGNPNANANGEAENPFASPKPPAQKLSLEVPSTDNAPGDDGASQTSNALTEVDAVQPIHDELQLKWAWWLLEIIPMKYSYQDGKGRWHTKFGVHLGEGRRIPDIMPKFHKSVQDRIGDADLKYAPRAVWKKGTETYVE
ncbi:hypothetical protein EIP91_004624 [Steccherinum ochraceum]|uniref:T6SS Phospholipase effector Tle1-like catalytic domain-containing protein n=1 Tax=Steccherinum ochraceum TaxID=92696 RepID=A0A4R0S1S6_9APHY|nr:hypothetical protein EIP91_004624 [Steccherinum ochraceum]